MVKSNRNNKVEMVISEYDIHFTYGENQEYNSSTKLFVNHKLKRFDIQPSEGTNSFDARGIGKDNLDMQIAQMESILEAIDHAVNVLGL